MGKIKPLEYLKQLTELQIDQKIYDNEKELKDLELLIVKIENDYRDLKEKTIQIETNVELISKQLVEEQNNYQDKLKVYLDKLGQSFSDEKNDYHDDIIDIYLMTFFLIKYLNKLRYFQNKQPIHTVQMNWW